MEEKTNIKVLYVDDEVHNLDAFKAVFRRHFEILTAISADEAKKILAEKEIHVLITDQRMPDTTGNELLVHAVEKYPDLVRVMLTAFGDFQSLEDAINRGQIFRYLHKPWNEKLLKSTIEEAYEIYDLKRKQQDLIKELKSTNEKLEQKIFQNLGIKQK